MKNKRIIQALACACAALAASAVCAGERWRYVETPRQRAVEPYDFMLGADGGLWTFGIDGVHRFDRAGGATASIPTIDGTGGFERGEPLADGGAILLRWTQEGDCEMSRVDASLRTRWSRRDACGVFAAAPDGNVWLATFSNLLQRIGGNGSVIVENHGNPGIYPRLAVMPDGGVAIANNGPGAERNSLARYDKDGNERWSFVRSDAFFAAMARGADGSLALAGQVRGRFPGDMMFYRFDANGGLVNEYRAAGVLESPQALALAGDGSARFVATMFASGSARHALHRFGPDGRPEWRSEACVSAARDVPSLVLLPDGSAVVTCPGLEHARFTRFDAAGTRVADVDLPTPLAKLAARADGSLLVLGSSRAGAHSLFVLDVDGRPVDEQPPQDAEPLALVGQKLAADGSSYLLSISRRSAGAQQVYLSKTDGAGALIWRRTFAAVAPLVRLAVAGGQACVTQAPQWSAPWEGVPQPPPTAPSSITCLSAADGSDRWSRSFPEEFAPHHFGAVDDGTFIHVRGDLVAHTHTFVRYDGGGNEIVRAAGSGSARLAAIGSSVPEAVVTLEDEAMRWQLVRYDAQGNAREMAAASDQLLEPAEVTADAALVWGRTIDVSRGPMFDLRSYSRDGRLTWTYTLPTPAPATAVVRAGGAVYLAASVAAGIPPTYSATRITRLDAQSGVREWTYTSPPAAREFFPGVQAFAVSGTRAALARGGPDRLRVLYLDTRDGTSPGEQSVACRRQCGAAQALALGADGTARVALPLAGPAHDATAALIALSDTVAQPAVRLDQPGLAGAWWAPYADGQGFAIDWLPGSRTWFMPWFTFSRTGGSGRDAQRWYAIGGSPAAGATQAELPIVQATGGTFDAGGGVASRDVGKATLRFTDCDNGTLKYTFDAGENEGASGTITLSRLSPATQDCVLADGSAQRRTTTPAGGFDARMTGSWLEEATAGQGFEFMVQPGGVFFAPWFTFDPAGTTEPGDPGRQRWYTLQGSLANAQDGRAELVIAQALGGAFDSVPTDNQFAVGSATLTMTACDRATLEYRFADDELADDLRGRTGTVHLSKSGGCTP